MGYTGAAGVVAERNDRRLASQISYDRYSITIASFYSTDLQRKARKKKRTRAPIHFPGLFVDSPAKLVTTIVLVTVL